MFSLAEAAKQIRHRQLSSVELTRLCLERIERLNPSLNAFITVTADLALRQARQADAEVLAGRWRTPLHGVPVALKDLIDLAGVRTTAASNQLRNRIAGEDAMIVTQLKQAGAVIVGKTNLHEFAFGGSGVISAFGAARNPWDTARISGGSSSGSAAAVVAGMTVAALGTDTAGSARDPAALCGIVGYRPSRDVWGMEGVIPLRKSFDTLALMTRTVEDGQLMLSALSNVPGRARAVDHFRVGVAWQEFFEDLDTEVEKCIERSLEAIRALVASVCEVKVQVRIPWTDFDVEILDYHRNMMAESPELYQPATLERLRACTAIPQDKFERAQNNLKRLRAEAEAIFDHVDIVITPTCPVGAPTIAELEATSAKELRAFEVQTLLRNTAPFSLLLWPSVSLPCGFTSQGLPVGLQISARPGSDSMAFTIARAYEQATDWHKRVPTMTG